MGSELPFKESLCAKLNVPEGRIWLEDCLCSANAVPRALGVTAGSPTRSASISKSDSTLHGSPARALCG